MIIWIILALHFISLVLALAWNRPFVADGGIWFYHMLAKPDFPTNVYAQHYRFTEKINHIVADFLLSYGPESTWAFAIKFSEFCLLFHPYLSLILCYQILKKAQHLEYIFFYLLSFAIAVLPGFGFSASVISFSISLFWPVFFASLFMPWGRAYLLYVSIGLFLLAFSYQTMFPLVLIISGILLFRARQQRVANGDMIALSIGCLSICLFSIYSFFRTYQLEKANVQVAISFFEAPFLYWGLCVLTSTYFLLFFQGKKYRLINGGIFATFILLSATFTIKSFLLDFERPIDFSRIFNFRLYSAPILFAIVILIGFHQFLINRRIIKNSTTLLQSGFSKWTLALALLIGVVYDSRFTYNWIQAERNLSSIVEKNKGCIIVEDSTGQLRRAGIEEWISGPISVIIQQTLNPQSIVFVYNQKVPVPDRCDDYIFRPYRQKPQFKYYQDKDVRISWDTIKSYGKKIIRL